MFPSGILLRNPVALRTVPEWSAVVGRIPDLAVRITILTSFGDLLMTNH